MHKEFRVNRSTRRMAGRAALALLAGLVLVTVRPANARVLDDDMKGLVNPQGDDAAPGTLRNGGHGPITPQAVPEINGPGRVSTVGNVWLKTTNIGVMGNPFTANSSDPSAQWPGPSGNEFLFYWGLWVGAKNPEAQDPALVRRVSQNLEWRPPTLAPEDRIYQSYDGQVHGLRDFDDDGDGQVDEEFLNGKDDDHDGQIDEDYAAISQQMYAFEMRDDTDQAVNANSAEKHVPFGLLVRQSTYAFAVPGANDFTAVNYDIYNQSGHMLDSVFVGFLVDQDVGPTALDRYFADDLPEPRVPQGDFFETLTSTDANFDATACTSDTIHVRGFSMTDDDGDLGRTVAASSFLLLGHTIDPTGVKGPRRVGFRMYRAYLPGTPFVQGGGPTVDLERFQTLAFGLNAATTPVGVDPVTGLISEERPDEGTKTDYFSICSVGPYLQWQNGEKISVQVALAVQRCDYSKPVNNPASPADPNPERYSAMISNAIEAQKTFRGKYLAPPGGTPTPDLRGRETGLTAAPGTQFERSDCHDEEAGQARLVTDDAVTWFDFDCDLCTGVPGLLLKNWLAAAPPPNPDLRLTAGDRKVTLEWDNLSEITPDPSSGFLDFQAYRIWKASNFTRPVGSSGPSEELWALLAEFKLYDSLTPLRDSVDVGADGVPNTGDPGEGDGFKDAVHDTFPVLLNIQTGQRLFPIDILPCAAGTTLNGGDCPRATDAPGDTAYFTGTRKYQIRPGVEAIATGYKTAIYPIGRYRYEDPNVLNGFVYFYSVTGKDSTGQRDVNGGRGTLAEQEGRRSAVEADGVTPQSAAVASAKQIFVVPNPYRGRAQWDLTPNAADPTGTHIDFFNMPDGDWTLRIFTIAGDLVQTIRFDDIQTNGKPQKENAADGQASWNLISRNGQDVVSGIYLFSVESSTGSSRGRFVIIR
jgi:hypothetical protein